MFTDLAQTPALPTRLDRLPTSLDDADNDTLGPVALVCVDGDPDRRA